MYSLDLNLCKKYAIIDKNIILREGERVKDIDDLIELIMGDEKLRESKTLSEKIYRDEPILRPASQLVKKEQAKDTPQKTEAPPLLMEMRRMVYLPEAQWKSREWLFYKQGKFMEYFKEDYDSDVIFDKYYPTYSDMTLEQQRAYFGWRTKVRRGEYSPTNLSFMFVYAYELINLIGVQSPQQGYECLKALYDKLGDEQPKLKKYVSEWLYDMVIYYGLDISLLVDYELLEFDKAITVLRDSSAKVREEIFSALSTLSSYNPERSAFYKEHAEDFIAVAVESYRELELYYKNHRKNTLFDKFFGKRVCNVHRMFATAVFCHYRTVKHTSVTVSEVRRYIFRNGEWYCEEYVGRPHANKQVGELLRAVDSIMRRRFGYHKQIQQPDIIKPLVKIIELEIDKLQEEKKREEAARVDIDLSKLGGIRRAADITRDKLIVEEEADEALQVPEPAPLSEAQQPQQMEQHTALLDEGEYEFVRALLCGGDHSLAAKNAGSMPSLLADSINEKLYDIFADTVIDFDGDMPIIIEDYEEELKGMILP